MPALTRKKASSCVSSRHAGTRRLVPLLRILAFLGLCLLCFACEKPGADSGEDTDTIDSNGAADDTADDDNEGSRPFGAPQEKWTWVWVDGTVCLDGSTTGIAVNWTRASNDWLIYFDGGGMCYGESSCPATDHHWNADDMAANLSDQLISGPLRRDDGDNPFLKWNYVFIPYCSGDFHLGNAEEGALGYPQRGASNFELDIERILPELGDAQRAALVGISAGGYGAMFHYDRIKQALPDIPVDLLTDSSIPFSDWYLAPCLQKLWRDLWQLDGAIPPDCGACREGDGGLMNIAPWLIARYPAMRMGIVAGWDDLIIRSFFGTGYSFDCATFGMMPLESYQCGLTDWRDSIAAEAPVKTFYVSETGHAWLRREYLGMVSSAGVTLPDWLRSFLDDGAHWENVGP
jgi:hypothetical protein